MTGTATVTSAGETAAPQVLTSSGLRPRDDHWSQPRASHYLFEVCGSVFSGRRVSGAFQANEPVTDDLGFNPQRMRAGEASAASGRYRPLADVVRELRAGLNA